MDASHDPKTLWAASIDRIDSAYRLLEGSGRCGPDLPMAAYCAGLSVETILQALAHLDNADHDARHDLWSWLNKCSPDLQDAIKVQLRSQWSIVCTIWTNRLRYYSQDAWLGRARNDAGWKRITKGNNTDRVKVFTIWFVGVAAEVHNKGLSEWQRKNR